MASDTCICGGSRGQPNPDCERCGLVAEIDRLRARVAELESAGRETVAALETYQQRLAEYGCESWIDAKGLIGRFWAAGLDAPATEGR